MTRVLFVLACAWVVAACGSPVVGATCRDGLSVCGASCVDLAADFRNCGSCGNDCGLFVCADGVCSTTDLRPDPGIDGGSRDGAFGDGVDGGGGGSGADSGAGSSATDGGGSGEGGASFPGCGLGETDCSSGCEDLLVSHAACGECGNECDADEVCSAGVCAPACEPPLTLCAGGCRDVSSDDEHCGRCGAACPSGICEDAECLGAIPGFVVVLGHDFATGTASRGMNRLAGNAVLALPRGAPVRMLEFRGEASSASIAGVRKAIELVRIESGRNVTIVDALEALVPVQLQQADVFVVHAQAAATKSTLGKLRDQWANALNDFLRAGGVVVLFEAPSTKNEGTFKLLPSPLFGAAGRSSIPAQTLRMIAPGLALTARVPDRYQSAGQSLRFSGVSDATPIVVDGDDAPVVLQHIILP
jgi:hypothetical protein